METLTHFANANFNKYPGSWKIILPDGNGCYFDALDKENPERTGIRNLWHKVTSGNELLGFWNRQKWEAQLKLWLDADHKIEVVLSEPNQRGIENWKKIMTHNPNNLTIYVLDASKALDKNVEKMIKSLETYHPITLIGPDDKNALYNEGHHPSHGSSVVAYNIDYISPQCCASTQEDALKQNIKLFDGLLGGNPEYLETIQADLPLFETARQSVEHKPAI